MMETEDAEEAPLESPTMSDIDNDGPSTPNSKKPREFRDEPQRDPELLSGVEMEGETSTELTMPSEDAAATIAPSPARVLSWGRSDFGCLLKKGSEDAIGGIHSFHHTTRTIVTVSSNVYHTAAVTSTGELYTCGQNDQGQVSDMPETVHERPHLLESLANHRVLSTSSGLSHTVCLTATGCAISFGGNESGQLGHSENKLRQVPPKVVNFSISSSRRATMVISKVACGDLFSLFLATSGELFGCGSATFLGNRANPQHQIVRQAERVEALVGSNIVDIAAGSAHALAVTSSGRLYGWGDNTHYQLGYASSQAKTTPDNTIHEQLPVVAQVCASDGVVVGVSAGSRHSLCWTSKGLLLGTGSNKYGQLAALTPRVESFQCISMSSFCVMAACGFNHSLVLCVDKDISPDCPSPPLARTALLKTLESCDTTTCIYGFGSNTFGQVLPSSTAPLMRTPVELTGELEAAWNVARVMYLSAGGDQSFAIGVAHSHLDAEGCGGVSLKKQFSSMVSKAVTPMDAPALLRLVRRGLDDPTDQQLQTTIVDTTCELFSSASLLAGSFGIAATASTTTTNASTPLTSVRYDVEGLEACLTSYMQLGGPAVSRLLTAMHQTVTDLEAALATSPPSESSRKVLCMLWQAPVMGNPAYTSELLLRVLQLTMQQARAIRETVGLLFPAHLFASRLLWPLHAHMEHRFTRAASASSRSSIVPIVVLCEAFQLLYKVNRRLRLVAVEQFYDTALSSLSNQMLVKDYLQWKAHHLNSRRSARTASSASSSTASPALAPVETSASVSDPAPDPSSPVSEPTTPLEAAPPAVSIEQPAAPSSDSSPPRPPFSVDANDVNAATSTAAPPSSDPAADNSRFTKTFFFCNYPYLLSAEAKRRIMLAESQLIQHSASSQAVLHGLLSSSNTAMPYFILPIQREHLLQQAVLHIAHADPQEMKKPLKVVFIDEEGVDEGGVRKEFFQILTAQLFDLNFGMFTLANHGRALWVNMQNSWSHEEYALVGSLLALALFNGVLLDVHLPRVLYKKLLQQPVGLEDLLSLDPELFAGLEQLLRHEPADEVEAVYCRTFTAEWDDFGAKRTVHLLPDGDCISVTGANRAEFVKLYVQWLLVKSVEEQFSALLRGFTRVISHNQLLLLSAAELELLMVGTPHLDFRELQAHTEYVGDSEWNADHPTVRAFWEVVHTMQLEEQQKFLQFATGSFMAPIGGLRNLGFKVQKMGPDSHQLPTAHTCFNILLLPAYSSKEKLQDRLLKAIQECEGFGLR